MSRHLTLLILYCQRSQYFTLKVFSFGQLLKLRIQNSGAHLDSYQSLTVEYMCTDTANMEQCQWSRLVSKPHVYGLVVHVEVWDQPSTVDVSAAQRAEPALCLSLSTARALHVLRFGKLKAGVVRGLGVVVGPRRSGALTAHLQVPGQPTLFIWTRWSCNARNGVDEWSTPGWTG